MNYNYNTKNKVAFEEVNDYSLSSSHDSSYLGKIGRDSFRSLTSDAGEEIEDESSPWGNASVASSVGSRSSKTALSSDNHVKFDREPQNYKSSNLSKHSISRSCAVDWHTAKFVTGRAQEALTSGSLRSEAPISSIGQTLETSLSPRRRKHATNFGASALKASLQTCRASDARKHRSLAKASKWDNVVSSDIVDSEDSDGDSLLDRFSKRGSIDSQLSIQSIQSHDTIMPLNFQKDTLSAPRKKGLGKLRRIMSQQPQHDKTEASILIASVNAKETCRRQTINASRRRPSHLQSLNLRTLAMSKPKYDSAHMWHLEPLNRASPQSLSCSNANGILFLDFDRTLAKEHTFKRSIKFGLKGLQCVEPMTIIEWFGGEERLDMCKRYLATLANMDIATVIVTHGRPQLVYKMMTIAGFFPSHDIIDGCTNDALDTHDQRPSHALTKNSRSERKVSDSFGSIWDIKLNSSITSSGVGDSAKVREQNKYGVVAIYGQSPESADKFLKAQCIADVCKKLSGKSLVRNFEIENIFSHYNIISDKQINNKRLDVVNRMNSDG